MSNQAEHGQNRRTILRSAIGITTAGFLGGHVAATNANAEIHDISAIIGADTITMTYSIPENATDEDSLRIRVFEAAGSEVGDSPGMPSLGDEEVTTTIPLTRELEADEQIYVAILPTGGYDLSSAESEALVLEDVTTFEGTVGIGPTLIEANPDAGFEYPYYL